MELITSEREIKCNCGAFTKRQLVGKVDNQDANPKTIPLCDNCGKLLLDIVENLLK